MNAQEKIQKNTLLFQYHLKKAKTYTYDMLLMVEKGMYQVINRYTKANNKYMKNYLKSIDSSYLMYLDANSLYEWAMSHKLPVNGFEWEEELSEFNESFVKGCNENSDRVYFPEKDVGYPKNLLILIVKYCF